MQPNIRSVIKIKQNFNLFQFGNWATLNCECKESIQQKKTNCNNFSWTKKCREANVKVSSRKL